MRRLLLAAVLLTTVATSPATADARAFSYGVSAAEVTSSSALLWGRSLKAGKVQLEIALDKKFAHGQMTKTITATRSSDLTVQARVTGLSPDKRYYYFFHQGKQRSLMGTFKTSPKPTAAKTIRFAVTGDADGVKRPDGTNYWDKDGAASFATYKAMTREKNDFNVNLGDTIYSDTGMDLGLPNALTLDLKR